MENAYVQFLKLPAPTPLDKFVSQQASFTRNLYLIFSFMGLMAYAEDLANSKDVVMRNIVEDEILTQA